jgi:hypothetical protein
MNREIGNLAARLIGTGQVGDGDVLALREAVWRGDVISLETLDALFLVNDRCAPGSPRWIGFFVEAVEHALLNQIPPPGFIGEDGARWLQDKIDRDGRVATLGEIELLVSVLEHAENAPDFLKAYALAQIEATIKSGIGPTRAPGPVRPNCVDDAEVQLLRRLIFAGGGEGAIIVGAQEADMLFRIKDVALGGQNAAGWLQLFVQGVGNHLLAHSDYRPLSREEAARLNAEMETSTPSIARFFSRMLPGDMFGRGTILDAFKSVFPDDEELFARPVAAGGQSLLTAAEAAWLKTHIAADAETDSFEKALMTFILDEVGNVPAPLVDLGRRRA